MGAAGIVFWVSFLILAYTYIGYALLLWGLARYRNNANESNVVVELDKLPEVTIIISAYNEEKYIKDKLENAINVNYPSSKIQVIMVSDGSSDSTLSIARTIHDDRLLILEQKERKGKSAALNWAFQEAKGEILILTDANVFFEADSVVELVNCLADKHCGCVSGMVELYALNDNEPLGEGAYMFYERYLYKKESLINSMSGIDGGMFAIRKHLVKVIPENMILDDLYTALSAAEKGMTIKYCETAIAKEYVPSSVTQEYRRKVRIAAGGFQLLKCFNVFKLLSSKTMLLMFVSHKLLRWISPFIIMLLLAGLIGVWQDGYIYRLFAVGILLVVVLSIVGMLFIKMRQNKLVYVSYYFVLIHVALLHGFIKFVTSTQNVTWDRVER